MSETIDSKYTSFTQEKSNLIINEVSKIVIGQYDFIEKLVVALLSDGHVLIEGVPGLAKTLSAKMISKTVNAKFTRVQFTPDLMPSDILGTKVFDLKTGNFYLKKGPIFTNFFLADEINRTPPKTQSALLESMEEKAVTIDAETHVFENLFMVLATQNPLEYEGTYPLPEAQLDRFMMKLNVDYIPQKFENDLLEKFNLGFDSSNIDPAKIENVCTFEDLKACRQEIQEVKVSSEIINYITSINKATRNSPNTILGGSPRASIALLKCSKTFAAMQGRNFVIPEDVKELAVPVLRHRVILKPEAGIEGIVTDQIIRNILNNVEVPR